MKSKNSDPATRRYLDSASNADKDEFVDTLLAATERVDPTPREVPQRVLITSRVLSLVVAGVCVVFDSWDLYLPVAVGMAWCPNYMGVVANRYILATPRHRPLVPWVTLGVGWLALSFNLVGLGTR